MNKDNIAQCSFPQAASINRYETAMQEELLQLQRENNSLQRESNSNQRIIISLLRKLIDVQTVNL